VNKARIHLENALAYLSIDRELGRMVTPMHTDKEVLVYLPNRVARDVASARREIRAALDELSDSHQ
jgi:hypothetical protein